MTCRFCQRTVALVTTVGSATSSGLYDSLKMTIMKATCSHLALCDEVSSDILEQFESLDDIKTAHLVSGDKKSNRDARNSVPTAQKPNEFEKI